MKRLLSAVFLFLSLAWVSVGYAAGGDSRREIWIVARADGQSGRGTEDDPLNLPTEAQWDSYFRALYRSGRTNMTFHLAPGIYYTKGANGNWGFDNWLMLSGWRFYGAGRDKTVVKLSSFRYLKPEDKDAAGATVMGQAPWGRTGLEIRDLTIDCNWTGFGAVNTTAFVTPVKGGTVTVVVENPERLAACVGKRVWLEDFSTATAHGRIGTYDLLAISGNTLSLRNAQFDAGTVTVDMVQGSAVLSHISDTSWLDRGQHLTGPGIPADTRIIDMAARCVTLSQAVTATGTGVRLGYTATFTDNAPAGVPVAAGRCLINPRMDTCGINIGSRQCRVQNVRVTNSGAAIYESSLGITITAINGESAIKPASGNVIRNCLVDNLWGCYGSGIGVVSNNPDTGDNGTTISAVVEDNIVESNGWHQAFGGYGMSHCFWRRNRASNAEVGWFTDSGYNRDVVIEGNQFDRMNRSGLQIGGGYAKGWERFVICSNTFTIPQNQNAILFNGTVTDSTVSANQFILAPGATQGIGIIVSTNGGTSGNTFIRNGFDRGVTNRIPDSVGRQVGNVYR